MPSPAPRRPSYDVVQILQTTMPRSVALGFDAVCTGHYAKVVEDADGNRELHRAADWAKDQSYVLGVLTHEQLKHSLFPVEF